MGPGPLVTRISEDRAAPSPAQGDGGHRARSAEVSEGGELVAVVGGEYPRPAAPAPAHVHHGHQALAATVPPESGASDAPADEEAAQDDALSARQEADNHQGGVAPLTRAVLIPGIVVIVI